MASQEIYSSALRKQVKALPEQPGVYLLRDDQGALLYVGKALSLRKRVSSYFRQSGNLSPRLERLVRRVRKLEVQRTASEAEALLLEARLIKEHHPPFNISLRDDKTYPMLKITREAFPRLVVTRRRLRDGAVYFGPYTDASLMHAAVRFMRRVFPLRTCKRFPKTPCLEYHLGQCLAPCVDYIDEARYQKIVDDCLAFLEGKRERLLRDLSRRMGQASKRRRFEEAARLRDQMQALTSVITAKAKSLVAGPLEQLQAALHLTRLPVRIEAFDISNVFGAFAVGSMVVFEEGRPHAAHYRRFKIKGVIGIDDFQMMQEILRRRYGGKLASQLPEPDLILIDGGKGHLSAALTQLKTLKLQIPIMGLAKRFEEIFLPGEKNPVVLLPTSPVLHLLQHIRDEAHRFAVTYHRLLRGKTVSTSILHEIPGIGPRRAMRLIKQFGSVTRLRAVEPRAIAKAAGVPIRTAEAVLSLIGPKATKTFRVGRSRVKEED